MIQEFISEICAELQYKYTGLKEDAIFRTLMKVEGEIPSPNVMRSCGMFIKCQQGIDSYEEFQWRGQGLFQIRLYWQHLKVWVEVKDLV